MPIPDGVPRDDLFPPVCRGEDACNALVFDTTPRSGDPIGFWAMHGDLEVTFNVGAAVTFWLSEQHYAQKHGAADA